MRALAPGKIILSGEHAVVYGKPALVLAVDRYAEATISSNAESRVHFELIDFDENSSLTLQALRELKGRLLRNYQMFLNGELGIRDVLKKPFHLFEFLFITLIDGLQLKLDRGLDILLHSDIPVGSGMGSSAATLVSVLKGLAAFFKLNFQADDFFAYGLEAEKLQHGKPSGVDPYISVHGGFVRFQNKQAQKLVMPRVPFTIVNTGSPQATTGECVSFVSEHFATSPIWDDFEAVTNKMQYALLAGDVLDVQRCVRENHKLLTTIGVVPHTVQNFIRDIEKAGGAAKIAGAGSVRGERGGMVTVYADAIPTDIVNRYGYELLRVKGEPNGARVV
ncbi:mevalonate kinase [candidate division KSB1 bacterium]|nr:mevalonate kinase [candidate division KSB1 bacterium]RQW00631.1 MAG: mevalonate kinase [candidate division KSB1 bacterium]